jgi:hypothetical protein
VRAKIEKYSLEKEGKRWRLSKTVQSQGIGLDWITLEKINEGRPKKRRRNQNQEPEEW